MHDRHTFDELRAKDADLHIRVSQDAQDRLRAVAKKQGVRIGVLVRWLVLEGLRGLEEAS